jgi:hypothetical protein
MHLLVVLLVIAVGAWLLAHFVSGFLAAAVVLIGVVYVVAQLVGGPRAGSPPQ